MKKRIILSVVIAAVILAVNGCNLNAARTGGQEASGIAYADPQIDMSIYVGGGYWEYEKDEEIRQVYFYIPEDLARNNVISISSVEIQGDPESQTNYIWDFFKQQIADMSGTESSWKEIMAGKYKGDELSFTMTEDNINIEGKYLVWNTDERIYICSVTAVENGKAQVDAAVDSILENFLTYEKEEEN